MEESDNTMTSDMMVGDAGGVAIAEGLKTNNALRTLHLDNNRMGDTAASAESWSDQSPGSASGGTLKVNERVLKTGVVVGVGDTSVRTSVALPAEPDESFSVTK